MEKLAVYCSCRSAGSEGAFRFSRSKFSGVIGIWPRLLVSSCFLVSAKPANMHTVSYPVSAVQF